jgi:nucleoid DNA-binding protein
MFQIFYRYLVLYKKVSLPGIGTFHVQRKPSTLNFEKKVFEAPAYKIAFTEEAVETDKAVYSIVSSEKQVNESEAIKHFRHFAEGIQKSLVLNRRVELPGVGWLSKNDAGVLQFEAVEMPSVYFPDMATERTVREEAQQKIVAEKTRRPVVLKQQVAAYDEIEQPVKKDYWWVVAIVLAAVALAGIAYYYYQNGSLR